MIRCGHSFSQYVNLFVKFTNPILIANHLLTSQCYVIKMLLQCKQHRAQILSKKEVNSPGGIKVYKQNSTLIYYIIYYTCFSASVVLNAINAKCLSLGVSFISSFSTLICMLMGHSLSGVCSLSPFSLRRGIILA